MELRKLQHIVPSNLPIVGYPDSTNPDLMHRVIYHVQKSINQGAKFAKYFAGGDEIKKVYDFLVSQINYEANGNKQDIITPDALIKFGGFKNEQFEAADCKSFTLFQIGVLANLKHKCTVRFAGYTPGSNVVNHVYPIIDGVICDAVYKITMGGNYGTEMPYYIKQDFILVN